MIILDTDVITILQRGRGIEYERIMARRDAAGEDSDFVTIISYEEQTRGWLAILARARSIERQIEAYSRLKQHLDDYCDRPIHFDAIAAAEYQRLVKSRIRIGTMDLKIAAIALAMTLCWSLEISATSIAFRI